MEKETITFDKALDMMKTNKEIEFYEYYDGLWVNDKFIVKTDGSDLPRFRKDILSLLPHTTLEKFQYYTRFGSEIDFEDFKGFPETIKVLNLDNFDKIPVEFITELNKKEIECHVQMEEYYADDNITLHDDSELFKLINNRWIPN